MRDGSGRVSGKFAERMQDESVRSDTRLVADFAAIYCKAKHKDRERPPITSDASALGVYGDRVPRMCEECAGHIRYAEKRRAFCPRDPKPFCAHCDTHCYKRDESEWQRQMMSYAGPRSMFHGYAIPGIKHALEALKWKREMARRQAEGPAATKTTPPGSGDSREERA